MVTTDTLPTLYRGQDQPWEPSLGSPIVFFVADSRDDDAFEAAWRYTFRSADGVIYRAQAGSALVLATGEDHADLRNECACIEDGGAWVAEILETLGADGYLATEGGLQVLGLRRDRLALLRNVEILTMDADPHDGWVPSSLEI